MSPSVPFSVSWKRALTSRFRLSPAAASIIDLIAVIGTFRFAIWASSHCDSSGGHFKPLLQLLIFCGAIPSSAATVLSRFGLHAFFASSSKKIIRACSCIVILFGLLFQLIQKGLLLTLIGLVTLTLES